jgi:hypothetical protein
MVQVEDDMMPQPESPRHVDHRARVENIMRAMAQGRVRPLFDALADDVTWRWMGVKQWSRAIEGKQSVVDTLFGGAFGNASSVIKGGSALHPRRRRVRRSGALRT